MGAAVVVIRGGDGAVSAEPALEAKRGVDEVGRVVVGADLKDGGAEHGLLGLVRRVDDVLLLGNAVLADGLQQAS